MKTTLTFVSRLLGYLLFVTVPFFLIGWIALLVWLSPIFGTIDAKHATPQKLTYWFLFRDLEDVPQEKRSLLLECYLRDFGSESGKKQSFEMLGFVKRQVQKIEIARRERVQQELTVVNEPEKLLTISVPLPERNIYFLAKIWFLDKMYQYEKANFAEKKNILSQMVIEIQWWQEYNKEYFLAAEILPPNVTESLQELEVIFARWKAGASPEDCNRIQAFELRLTAALVSNGINQIVGGNAAGNVTESVTNAVGNFFGSFTKPQNEKKAEDKKTSEELKE
ncbi:MAG: hypothetical protein LBJ67_14785 [Planctomycetaceae bacterium]|jgi:hypothetical protein|nr:hypothetical protein [Planctomycetaceae bacterium]